MCSKQILNKGEIEKTNGEMANSEIDEWRNGKFACAWETMCQTVICARRGRLKCLRSNVSKIMPWNIRDIMTIEI